MCCGAPAPRLAPPFPAETRFNLLKNNALSRSNLFAPLRD